MKDKIIKALTAAKNVVSSASRYGVDATSLLSKLTEATDMLDRKIITIALLGSFSDGKTTIISGLLGKVLDNMKISTNESSDEIIEYEADFLGKKFRFIDTPGLFGTKHKIEDGQKVRLSDITEQYISKADIVVYVTEAVNPLPDSHSEALKQVMRGLRKLDNAIFVLNKMDQTGCGFASSEGFASASEIKKANLKDRLQRVLNLTNDETGALRIVCLAANPGGKDISSWFERADKYFAVSNIGVLRNAIKDTTSKMDTDATILKTALDMAIDTVSGLDLAMEEVMTPLDKALNKTSVIKEDMVNELSIARDQLINNKRLLSSELDVLEESIKMDVENASVETIGSVIDNLGTTDGNVSLSIVIRKIEDALSICSQSTSTTLERTAIKIEEQSSLQNRLIQDGLDKGAKLLKNAKVSPEMVGNVRDMFFKNFKFKPWGKINMAADITKWSGRVGSWLTIAQEVYGWYKQHKAKADLAKAKRTLKEAISELFTQARNLYRTDESFYANFAPAYIELEKLVSQKHSEIEEMDTRLSNLRAVSSDLRKWQEDFIEDAEYTEITT